VRERLPAVYIMTNCIHTVLYTGVTADLASRVFAHRTALDPACFTARYRAFKLVYYEAHADMPTAIRREKQIKGWTRVKKVALIETLNASWQDLWPGIT
jgi:putative endonuclease